MALRHVVSYEHGRDDVTDDARREALARLQNRRSVIASLSSEQRQDLTRLAQAEGSENCGRYEKGR